MTFLSFKLFSKHYIPFFSNETCISSTWTRFWLALNDDWFCKVIDWLGEGSFRTFSLVIVPSQLWLIGWYFWVIMGFEGLSCLTGNGLEMNYFSSWGSWFIWEWCCWGLLLEWVWFWFPFRTSDWDSLFGDWAWGNIAVFWSWMARIRLHSTCLH